CDRRTCGERAHRCHRRFFSPALGPQKPHLRGTKDSADYGTRTKAPEAICVCKTPQFSHTGIMPDFFAPEISSKPCPEPFSSTERYNFTHSNPRRAFLEGAIATLGMYAGRGRPDPSMSVRIHRTLQSFPLATDALRFPVGPNDSNRAD